MNARSRGKKIESIFGLLATVILLTAGARAQQNFDAVQIQTASVAEGLFMLVGSGGNIGLSVGEDGAFLIDDQFAPLTDKIKAAVAAQTDRPIRFVVNTHWHGDHTGGNEHMGRGGAIIVAHENVRTRMSSEQFVAAFNMRTPPSPPQALPVITFADELTFHWNGDAIRVFHVDAAHTDGDAIIHFARANVLHMGDAYFNGMYPFIDTGTGGTLDGMIAAVDQGLALSDEHTRIIPGHGPLSNRAELMAYRSMLTSVRDHVLRLRKEGKGREEVVAARPTVDFDEKWGKGFLKPDAWVGIVYDAVGGK